MKVVSNAGPLIALARIEQLDLLPLLYQEILLPEAVHREATLDPIRPGAQELRLAPWLKIHSVNDPTALQLLRCSLDLGESEAIVLARSHKALLLIDEQRGRSIASSLHVRCSGTLGVLLAARQEGHLSEIRPVLDLLVDRGVWISPSLVAHVLRLAGEAR